MINSNFLSYRKTLHLDKDEFNDYSSTKYQTHRANDMLARGSFKAAKILSLPWRMAIRSLAYVIEPLPGANKNRKLLGLGIRVTALFATLILLPIGLLTLPLALPFHFFSHSQRPIISVIHNKDAAMPVDTSPDSLTVRTHNLGFVYEFMRIVGDLRDVKTRAEEVSQWIEEDTELPEVIFFQEAFHMDATEVLCNALKKKYPYVVYNIAPHAMGLSNGGIIASRYPIEDFSYRPFENLLGPEKWSTRGLLKIRIDKGGKKVDVYGCHLQALLGKERSKIRVDQLTSIIKWMKEDKEKDPADCQLLVGDMNASQITAWGEESTEDDAFFDLIKEEGFIDVLGNDHDEKGKRILGAAKYTALDTPEGVDTLDEPEGSWYIGPFADKGLIMRIKEWTERKFNNLPKKSVVKKVPDPHQWGTSEWSSVQHANTARFDFVLRKGEASEDRAEIRRVKVAKDVQSAPTDHAPIDATIKIA